MWYAKRRCPRCLCHLLVALITLALFNVEAVEINDFFAVSTLPDGETETRIHYKGITAKETTSDRRLTGHGICLRQVSDGKHFIQLIYDENDVLRDCEIVSQRDEVKKFLFKFKNDLRNLVATSNVTVESLDNKELPSDVGQWLKYDQLKESCRAKHREARRAARRPHHGHNSRHPNRFKSSRNRGRGKRSSLLIAPGTVWCGLSDNALSYTHLGPMSQTDKCCRRHDHCKFDIPGYSMKYGYYNSGLVTLSHCHCDASFRACLKMVDSSDANLVGKLFFNVVQTKCFVLKPKKKCVKRSWWGKCEKHRFVKQAILRDNLSY